MAESELEQKSNAFTVEIQRLQSHHSSETSECADHVTEE